MYRYKKRVKSSLDVERELMTGETIETKVERITTQKEPIKDGAPEIFTPRSEGVNAAHNIRTDRFEIAAEAMDKVHKSKRAQRDAKATPVVKLDNKNKEEKSSENEPLRGTE